MPRGDKSKYTGKHKRQARHIEEGLIARGVSQKAAEGRAWAVANKEAAVGKRAAAGASPIVELLIAPQQDKHPHVRHE